MNQLINPQTPKVYRTQDNISGSVGEYQYHFIKPYFPALHPNTMWVINRIRSGDATPLVNILKTREKMNVMFKYMYFQILDKPAMYNPKNPLDRPMFNDKTYLFLNLFGVALYFKCETIVRVLAPIRVGKIDNPSSYESVSEVSVPQYAAYLHDRTFGDLLSFYIPTIMMRREAYFAIAPLVRFGAWSPKNQFSILYYRRNYHSTKKYCDWMEYAWSLLDERPYLKICELVTMLNSAGHSNFYLGDKVFFQPINVRYYNAPWHSAEQDQRTLIVYRSYPRRMLCKLFLHKDPLRVLPQVVAFVRVFQRQRYFISQSTKALNPEFRMSIQSCLEERFINLSPICNANEVNSSEYVDQNSHKTSIYDYDNIIALLIYFLVVTAERKIESLKNNIVQLLFDILVDTQLLYIFSREPAVNISYYLSMLVDGPFVQPNDLQHLLKNIPPLIMKLQMPDKRFPPFIKTSDSPFEKQIPEAVQIVKTKVPQAFQTSVSQACEILMKYRMDIDNKTQVNTIDHCEWKNHYLVSRLRLNMKTMHSQQQTLPANRIDQRLTMDDSGGLHACAGWRGFPRKFMSSAKDFAVSKQRQMQVKRTKQRANKIDLWSIEELELRRK